MRVYSGGAGEGILVGKIKLEPLRETIVGVAQA